MKRWLFASLTAVSFLFSVLFCTLWLRGRYGIDEAAVTYDRYVADNTVVSDRIYFTSDHRMWIGIYWGQLVFNTPNMVWGYQVAAHQSGGKPKLQYVHFNYDPPHGCDTRPPADIRNMPGWGPLHWKNYQRSGDGEQFQSFEVGASHWLLVVCFLILPLRWLYRYSFSLSRSHGDAALTGQPAKVLNTTADLLPYTGV